MAADYSPRTLIAIPVHNELQHVEAVLARIRGFHPDILVIDDGSTDGTGPLLERIAHRGDIKLLAHRINRGYGRSIIDGFHYAASQRFDWVVTIDCDEQHEPERIPDFLKEIAEDRWDIISGSRYLIARPDDDLPPPERRSINARITSLLNELFGWTLTDSFCGYKAHRVQAMMQLRLDEPGYAFPLQFWPQAHHAKLRITEIPVRLIYNDPNRHFGGVLDDAANRRRHYLQVLHRELAQLGETPLAERASQILGADEGAAPDSAEAARCCPCAGE